MSSNEELNDREKAMEELLKHADPAMVAKYGNPLDKDDPRMWLPSTRQEKGVSEEDRLRFLELDVESLSFAFSNLTKGMAELYNWMRQEAENRLIEQVKADPEGTLRKLLAGDISIPGVSAKEVSRQAESVKLEAEQMISTPDGPIKVKDIPGYRDDPEWRPSPDWIDANCMCENHQRLRAESEKHSPGTGFYL